jgi:hypothetical protein
VFGVILVGMRHFRWEPLVTYAPVLLPLAGLYVPVPDIVRKHFRWAREHRYGSVKLTFVMAFFVAGSMTTSAEPFTPHGLKVVAGYVFTVFLALTVWCLLVHWSAVLSSALARRRAASQQV